MTKNKIILNPEQKEYLRTIITKYSYEEISNIMSKKYNIDFKKRNARYFREKWNLQPKIKPKLILNKEQEEYYKSIVVGNNSDTIKKLFYKKYKIELNRNKIAKLKQKYNIKSGVDTRFIHKPIGSITKDITGCLRIKVGEPNTWIRYSRYLYEKKYGKIPEDKCILIMNQDQDDLNIENMRLIDKKDNLTMGRHRLHSKDRRITETGLMVAHLINKTKNIEKGSK